jgi:hypothetical protein
MRLEVGGNRAVHFHEHDVRVGHRDLQLSVRCQALSQRCRVGVVVGETRYVVLQRIKPGRGENAHLPQTAAHHLARASRLLD